MGFIIDTYDHYCVEGNEVFITTINDIEFCIRKVEIEWGLPVLIQKKIDDMRRPEVYKIYERLDDAIRFLRMVKELNKR